MAKEQNNLLALGLQRRTVRAAIDTPPGGSTRLQPVAQPVDRFYRPAPPSPVEDLFAGLGRFSAPLANLARQMQEQSNAAAAAAGEAKIGGMTKEERDAAIRDGLPEFEDPWFKAAFMRTMGQKEANEAYQRAIQAYAALDDKASVDFEAFIQEQFAPSFQRSDDPHYVKGLTASSENYTESLRARHTQVVLQTNSQKRDDAVTASFNNTVSEAVSLNLGAAETATEVWNRVAANAEFLRLPVKDQQRMLFGVLSGMAAEGRSDLIEAIVHHKNSTIRDNLSLKGDVNRLLEQAKRRSAEKNTEDTVDIRDRFAVLAEEGRLDEATDELNDFRKKYPDVMTDERLLRLRSINRSSIEAKLNREERQQARAEAKAAGDAAKAERDAARQAEEDTLTQQSAFAQLAEEGKLESDVLAAWRQNHPGVITPAEVLRLEARNRAALAANADEAAREAAREAKQRLANNAAAVAQSSVMNLEEDLMYVADPTTGSGGLQSIINPAVIPTADGGTRRVSVSEQRDIAVQAYFRSSAVRAQTNGETPEGRFKREVEWLNHNGVVNPLWASKFAAIPVNWMQSAATGTIPESLRDAGDLYMTMHDLNVQVTNLHVPERLRKPLESFRVQVNNGVSPTDAWTGAANIMLAEPDPIRKKDVEEAVNLSNTLFDGWTNGQPVNAGYVRSTVKSLAEVYVASGMEADAAITEARDVVRASHVEILGSAIPRNLIPGDPDQFGAAVTELLTEIIADKPAYDISDLSIMPIPNGRWIVINRSNGIPIGDSRREFAGRDMAERMIRKRDAEIEKLQQRIK